jgi:hypothetical protein
MCYTYRYRRFKRQRCTAVHEAVHDFVTKVSASEAGEALAGYGSESRPIRYARPGHWYRATAIKLRGV